MPPLTGEVELSGGEAVLDRLREKEL